MASVLESLKTFEDIEAMLRHWASFADPYLYDAGGMAAMFTACLDNIRARMLDAELEDMGAYFTDEQKFFLLTLATLRQRTQTPGEPAQTFSAQRSTDVSASAS